MWDYSVDAGCGSLTSAFLEGRCAIGYAPPGCWKNLFIDSDDDGEGEGALHGGMRPMVVSSGMTSIEKHCGDQGWQMGDMPSRTVSNLLVV